MISKEDNPMKMKKRLIGIIGIVVTIVLVMLVVVMLNKGKDKQQPQLEETDNKTQTAEDLAPYTSMDVDKIDGLNLIKYNESWNNNDSLFDSQRQHPQCCL